MAKTKKKTFEKVEKKEVKQEWECYTFIENVSIGNDIYGVWERVLLKKEDMKAYWPYVVFTKDYKGKQIYNNKARDCWC